MLKKQEENTINFKKWQQLSTEEKKLKYPLGILKEIDNPESEYTVRYQKIIEQVNNEGAL